MSTTPGTKEFEKNSAKKVKVNGKQEKQTASLEPVTEEFNIIGSSEENGDSFTPYIPAEKKIPEFTITVLLLGLIQAIIFGVADSYLFLKILITL